MPSQKNVASLKDVTPISLERGLIVTAKVSAPPLCATAYRRSSNRAMATASPWTTNWQYVPTHGPLQAENLDNAPGDDDSRTSGPRRAASSRAVNSGGRRNDPAGAVASEPERHDCRSSPQPRRELRPHATVPAKRGWHFARSPGRSIERDAWL